MLLILMTLCLGVSGGRLGDCLLHKHAEDSSSPAVSEEVITSDAEIISTGPESISDNDNSGSSSTIIHAGPGFFPASPGLPNFAPNPALFNQDGENIPVPSSANIRRQEDGKQVSFFSSVPFAGGVSAASFSSVGSYQGPQGGFVQFSQPLAGFQVGYNGAHLSPPVVVCLSWCLDPTGNYFCCRYTGGQCPLEPDTCPASAQPTSLQLCSSDFNCGFGFKCCSDRCSERFVCKAAVA